MNWQSTIGHSLIGRRFQGTYYLTEVKGKLLPTREAGCHQQFVSLSKISNYKHRQVSDDSEFTRKRFAVEYGVSACMCVYVGNQGTAVLFTRFLLHFALSQPSTNININT